MQVFISLDGKVITHTAQTLYAIATCILLLVISLGKDPKWSVPVPSVMKTDCHDSKFGKFTYGEDNECLCLDGCK